MKNTTTCAAGLCSNDIGTFLSSIMGAKEGELERICDTQQGPAAEEARAALDMWKNMEERRTAHPITPCSFGGKGAHTR